ncbi:MAG: DNA polymerase III subunit chi [Alphaproteobacteria bacterium]
MSDKPEIRFYHLERSALEQALVQLAPKIYGMGHRIVVQCASVERLKALDTHLWSYRKDSFIPHGSAADGNAEEQPIWLTVEPETPNGADILILCEGSERAEMGEFKIVCDLFDGVDPDALSAARNRWKQRKDEGYPLTYWQQSPRGAWEKKATANMPRDEVDA